MTVIYQRDLPRYKRLVLAWTVVLLASLAAVLIGFIFLAVVKVPPAYSHKPSPPLQVVADVMLGIGIPVAFISGIVRGFFADRRNALTGRPTAADKMKTVNVGSKPGSRPGSSRMEYRAFMRRATGYKRGNNRGPRPF